MADIVMELGIGPADIVIGAEVSISDVSIGAAVQPPVTEVMPDPYPGPYTVTPMAYVAQVLETRDKSMTDDLTVEEIPVYRVSNPEGGYTVNIGG